MDDLFIGIERGTDEAVYAQIARQVRAAVAAGALAPGDRLPSVRALARDLGVNLNTVARAYRMLEDEGFLTIRGRSGVAVAEPAEEPAPRVLERLESELASVVARLRQAGFAPADVERLVRERLDRSLTRTAETG